MGLTLTDIPTKAETGEQSVPDDPVLKRVLRNVDGLRDLKRIAATCGLSDAAVLVAADDLLQEGRINIKGSSKFEARERTSSSRMYSQVSASQRPRRKSSGVHSSRQSATNHAAASKRPSEAPTSKIPRISEIPRARMDEIDAAFTNLDDKNHYDILGVGHNATKAEIRDAYFHLSKRFHPDSLYGHKIGEYRTKMELVFRKLTDAYDVLSRKTLRERYNREQGIRDVSARPAPTSDPASSDPTSDEPPRPRASSSAPTRQFRRLSDKEQLARRDLHRKQLLAATEQGKGRYRLSSRPTNPAKEAPSSDAPKGTAKAVSPAPPRPTPSMAPARSVASSAKQKDISKTTSDLVASLKMTALKTGGVSRAETHAQNALESAGKEDWHGAVNSIRLAISISPERRDLKDRLEEYRTKLHTNQAASARTKAQRAAKHGDMAKAAASWKKVCEAAPDDLEAHLEAVQAGLEAGIELADGKRLAARAVEIAPENGLARRCLAKVFIEAGMKLNAKRELKKALELDPNDNDSKDMLRKLR